MPKLRARKLPAGYDRIREWLHYDGDPRRPSAPKLWKEDKVIYDQLVQLRTLYFQKAHDYHDALIVMMKSYGISEATFNRLHHGLIYIFGDMEKESKEFEKTRLKATAFKILQKALSTSDLKAANSAMANLIKLGGHDRDEGDKVPLEMLNPGAYALVLDDTALKMMQLLDKGGPIDDLTSLSLPDAEVEDIEHEVVTEIEAATP